MLDSRKGKVLPLISQEHSKLVLISNTLEHLSKYKGPYGFICICGDYRSGKSFLLNSLFFDYQGFETSGTTEACTKGINIWSQPIQKEGITLWVLDTEGFGSMDKDSNYDGKIFLLSMLISNVLLYNSFGAIDEHSITKLGLVCSEAHLISPQFSDVKLFWILRDFSLEMVDKKGRKLSADQYLEDCLKDCENNHNKVEKELLKRLFKQRHCVPLIRPVIDQTTLSNLKGVSKEQIRQQFKQEISQLSHSLDVTLTAKQIGGMYLDQSNMGVVLSEFVGVLNSGNIDCELICSYDKIKLYQQQREKERISSLIEVRIQKLRQLIPVKQEHLTYLEQQLNQIIEQQIAALNQHFSNHYCQIIKTTLLAQVKTSLDHLQVLNKSQVENQIKDYLYRQMIEVYPSIITLPQNHFQSKFQQSISKIKKDCSLKYLSFFKEPKELQNIYCTFLEKQTRKIFYELVKRWRNSLKELQQRLEETKRFRTMTDEELNRLKEEKRKIHKTLEDYRREEGRSLSKLKIQMEQTYKDQLTTVITEYELRLKNTEQLKNQEITALKSQLDTFEQSTIQMTSTLQYEKQSFLQKMALEKEKTQLLEIKSEQQKNSYELQLQQMKSTYQNKLKIGQIRCNEIMNTLASERKKFQVLTEERRKEEGQIMDELDEKNEKIEKLTNELLELEQKYKNEMENILNEEKDILVKTISNKIHDYEYKCQLYQNQLQQCHSTIQELHSYEQRCDDLELSTRELKRRQEEDADKIELLNGKIKKYEKDLEDRNRSIDGLRQEYQKELSLAKETMCNNSKFIKEAEERHQEQLSFYQRKIQTELANQSEALSIVHEANLKQNRTLLQQKFSKEKTQLKEIISNNYEEIERLKLTIVSLQNQIEKIYIILSKIKSRHQQFPPSTHGTPDKNKTGSSFNPFAHPDQLLQISESPEEESGQGELWEKKEKMENVHFMAQELQAIYESMHQQIQLLEVEKSQLKNSLEQQIQELQHYQLMASKTKGESREYLTEVETLRNKVKLQATITEDYKQIQLKADQLEKENYQLKKDIHLKDQSSSNQQTHYLESVTLHKETISTLTQQNNKMASEIRTLTDTISELQAELERFKMWAEVQSKPASGRQPQKTEDGSKIKDLEMELKRQIARVQEQKLAEIQRYSKQQNRLSSLMAEHRLDELGQLRKQNQLLYQQLKECHDKQLRLMSESKTLKQQQSQYQQSRYQALKHELQQYKQGSRQIINRMQMQLQTHVQQKLHLKKEFNDLESNLMKKYELTLKLLQEQVTTVKKDRDGLNEIYSKKITILQESLNSKTNQYEKKVAAMQVKWEEEREQWEKEMQRVGLQGERHRMKYEQLLKVNNELVREAEGLKSKAHQQTLKEKYKEKIGKLFND